MSEQSNLFRYGILDEDSDVRAHVGVRSRSVYVFQTARARQLLVARGDLYQQAPAFQQGVQGATAMGWKVPWDHIPGIRRIRCHGYNWAQFCERDDTSAKGMKAVAVVCRLMEDGYFPLWIKQAEETADTKIQIRGTDMIVWNKTKIQVKCDWNCRKGEGCTGNLYLQNAERNPLRRH